MAKRSARKHRIRHVVTQVTRGPWVVRSDKADAICEFLSLREAGHVLSRAEIEASFGDQGGFDEPLVMNGIAVLPLHGLIAPRMNLMTEYSGGTSCEQFSGWMRAAMNDVSVREIVLDVDSPGGQASGVEELGELIYAARAKKQVTAVVGYMACSGGYWLASAAHRVIAAPSAELGSIGVVRIHSESSKANEKEGRTVTVLRIPEFKQEANSHEPLTEEARAHFEKLNAQMYDKFVAAVARNRGVSMATVKSEFGRGRYFYAPEAIQLGMADGLGTLESVLRDLSNPNPGSRRNAGRATVHAGPQRRESPPVWKQIRASLAARGLCAADANEATVRRVAGMFLAAHSLSAETADAGIVEFLNTLPGGQVVTQPPQVTAPQLNDGNDDDDDDDPTVVVDPDDDDDDDEPQMVAPRTPPRRQRAAVATPRRQRQVVDEQSVMLRERQRIADIRARGQMLGVDDEQIQAAIDGGLSLGASLTRFTAAMSPSFQPVQTFGGGTALSGMPTVHGAPVDRLIAGASEALAARAQSGSRNYADAVARHNARMMGTALPERQQLSPEARPFQHMALLQIAAATISARGARPHLMQPEEIATVFLQSVGPQMVPFVSDASYNTPGMYPNLMSVLANKVMDDAVEYAESTYRLWTYGIAPVPDFKPQTFVSVGASGELPWHRDGSDFEQSDRAEDAAWISVESYGDEFKLTPMMIVNNNLQAFTDLAEDKQIAHELTMNRLAVNLLTGNPVLPDNIPLFDAQHGNVITPTGAAPSSTQASAMRRLMRSQMSVGGKRRARISMAIALVGTKHETAAEQTFLPYNMVPVTDATINTFRGKVAPVVEPMLDDAAEDPWYGIADPRRVRTLIHAFQQGYQNGGQRRTYYKNENGCQVFQIEGRMGVAVRNFRGAVRNPGT